MVRRKIVFLFAILCLLVTPTIGLGFVYVVYGNPVIESVPSAPVTAKPIITLLTPSNGTGAYNNTALSFNVAIPPQWYWGSYTYLGANHLLGPCGSLNNASCTLDGKEISYNDTIYFEWNNTYDTVNGWNDFGKFGYNHTCTCISQVSSGIHNLTISINVETWYNPSGTAASYGGNPAYYYDVSTAETFTFEVNTLAVTTSSLENKTYTTSNLPLVYDVNGTTSWIGYSLDSQANQTIYGNSTLTDLTEGNHSLIVYANDTYGNMAKSDIIYFNVVLPTPTPTPTPSPTQQPTPSTVGNEGGWWISYELIAALIGLGLIASLVIMIYLRKREMRKF